MKHAKYQRSAAPVFEITTQRNAQRGSGFFCMIDKLQPANRLTPLVEPFTGQLRFNDLSAAAARLVERNDGAN